MIIVTVNGCFDVLHIAHLRLLQEARKLGDRLIILLNSDESVRRLKGEGRPINNLCDRIEMLKGLSCVDEVIVFEEDTPLRVLSVVKPNIHVKGGVYVKELVDEEKKLVESLGGKVVFITPPKKYSSTNLIGKLKTCGDDGKL